MFQIIIKRVDNHIPKSGEMKMRIELNKEIAFKVKEALFHHISLKFPVDQIEETLVLEYSGKSGRIKRNYSLIKNLKFKAELREHVESICSGHGLIL